MSIEQLKSEEIRKQIRELHIVREEIVKDLEHQLIEIDQKIVTVQDQCPHEQMSSAPYTRWCEDCGRDWDTT